MDDDMTTQRKLQHIRHERDVRKQRELEPLLDQARKAVRRYAEGIREPVDRNRQMAYEDGLVNWILSEVAKGEKGDQVKDDIVKWARLFHCAIGSDGKNLQHFPEWVELEKALYEHERSQKT